MTAIDTRSSMTPDTATAGTGSPAIITSASPQLRVPTERDFRTFPRQADPRPADERVAAILRDIRAAAERPLTQAIANPPQAYLDEAFFAWEMDHLLKKDWVCVCHVSQIPAAGDYYNLDLFGEPITALHGKDGLIRVLSRVCPHRAMDIMPAEYGYEPRGNKRVLVCPYHRWTFELDGSVKGCPEMHRAEDFNKRDWKLHEHRTEVWNGFVFVNFSGDAEPVASQYADLDQAVGHFNLAEMHVAVEMEWDTRANWKVIMENWIESYHHLGVHYQTLNMMVPAQDTWVSPEHPHFIHCHLPYKDSIAERAVDATHHGHAGMGWLPIPNLPEADATEWGLYIAYPHFQLLTFSDRVVWYRLQPLGPNRTRWLTTMLITKPNLALPDYAARYESESKMLRDFHLEDMQVTEAVQRGLESGRAVRGRLSHLDEPVWLFQRWLAARAEDAYPGKGDTLPVHPGAGKPATRYGAGK